MARPKPVFTQQERDEIRLMARCGTRHEDIAKIKRVHVVTLRKNFEEELREGTAAGRDELIKRAHQMAMSGKHPVMMIFLLKTKCGFREVLRPGESEDPDKTYTPTSTGTTDPVQAAKIYQKIMSTN